MLSFFRISSRSKSSKSLHVPKEEDIAGEEIEISPPILTQDSPLEVEQQPPPPQTKAVAKDDMVEPNDSPNWDQEYYDDEEEIVESLDPVPVQLIEETTHIESKIEHNEEEEDIVPSNQHTKQDEFHRLATAPEFNLNEFWALVGSATTEPVLSCSPGAAQALCFACHQLSTTPNHRGLCFVDFYLGFLGRDVAATCSVSSDLGFGLEFCEGWASFEATCELAETSPSEVSSWVRGLGIRHHEDQRLFYFASNEVRVVFELDEACLGLVPKAIEFPSSGHAHLPGMDSWTQAKVFCLHFHRQWALDKDLKCTRQEASPVTDGLSSCLHLASNAAPLAFPQSLVSRGFSCYDLPLCFPGLMDGMRLWKALERFATNLVFHTYASEKDFPTTPLCAKRTDYATWLASGLFDRLVRRASHNRLQFAHLAQGISHVAVKDGIPPPQVGMDAVELPPPLGDGEAAQWIVLAFDAAHAPPVEVIVSNEWDEVRYRSCVEAFRDELGKIEREMKARPPSKASGVKYEWLLPSLILTV